MKEVNDKNKKNLKKMMKCLRDTEKECENIHKRLTLKLKDERNFAISKFAREILEILDNFDRFFLELEKKKDEEPEK